MMNIKENKIMNALKIFKRLAPYLRPYIFRLSIGILCGILHGGSAAGMILILNFVLTGISGEQISNNNFSSLLNPPEGYLGDIEVYRIILSVILLPLAALIQGFILFTGRYCIEWTGSKIVTDLRKDLFQKIHSLPLNYFTKNRVGNLISRLISDMALLLNLVTQTISDVVREPFTFVGCIVAMIILDVKLTLIILLILPISLLPVILIGRRVRTASRKAQENVSNMLSSAQESISNAIVVKAFRNEQAEVNNFNFSNIHTFKMNMRQLRARALSEPIFYLLGAFSISIIVVYSYFNNLSLALLMSFFAATMQLYKPLKKLSQVHIKIQLAAPGAERIFSIIDTENTIIQSKNPLELSLPIESIVFKDVNFAYDEDLVLKNINFEIYSGQKVAIVGSSGTGKSTLANLLPRFYDVKSGQININGIDIKDYSIESLRKNIGIVTQETFLFNRSIRDNISYGIEGVKINDIINASKKANAHTFIENLDLKYDTIIGERASKLSGGMAQRICIARAILKNSPILILDEATSSLDSESENLVQDALNELMDNRTVIIIAHRLSTIINSDVIIVLDQGKIIEKGSHSELISKNGKYKFLYDSQFNNEIN